jgi:hypothetical protein
MAHQFPAIIPHFCDYLPSLSAVHLVNGKIPQGLPKKSQGIPREVVRRGFCA